MPRVPIGHKKRESTGFSCDPDVLKDARVKAGRASLSSIIEDLLKQWLAGTVTLTPLEAPPVAVV
jgi:hypothetical protein